MEHLRQRKARHMCPKLQKHLPFIVSIIPMLPKPVHFFISPLTLLQTTKPLAPYHNRTTMPAPNHNLITPPTMPGARIPPQVKRSLPLQVPLVPPMASELQQQLNTRPVPHGCSPNNGPRYSNKSKSRGIKRQRRHGEKAYIPLIFQHDELSHHHKRSSSSSKQKPK